MFDSSIAEPSQRIIGTCPDSEQPILLPWHSPGHALIVGGSLQMRNTIITNLAVSWINSSAEDPSQQIVIVDLHGHANRDILHAAQPALENFDVRHIDLSDPQRSSINPLISSRVDSFTIAETVINNAQSHDERWPNRAQDAASAVIELAHEHNSRNGAEPREMFSLDRALSLLAAPDLNPVTRGSRNAYALRALHRYTSASPAKQNDVMSYTDACLRRINSADRSGKPLIYDTANDVETMLKQRSDQPAVLMFSAARSLIGAEAASLAASWFVNELIASVKDQESLNIDERRNYRVLITDFRHIAAVKWPQLFPDIRRYGCSITAAAPSIDGSHQDTYLANSPTLIAGALTARQTASVAGELEVSTRELLHLPEWEAFCRTRQPGADHRNFRMRVSSIFQD